MQLRPYLMFDGRCEEAFKFYEKSLGGKITAMMTHKGTPAEAHTPPEWHNKILHAALDVGGEIIMGSDDNRYQGSKGFSVALQVKEPAEAERIFNALSEKGNVIMPLSQTFWSPKFGMCVDRFGVPWMIDCEPQS